MTTYGHQGGGALNEDQRDAMREQAQAFFGDLPLPELATDGAWKRAISERLLAIEASVKGAPVEDGLLDDEGRAIDNSSDPPADRPVHYIEVLEEKLHHQQFLAQRAHREFHDWGYSKGNGFDVQHAPDEEFDPAALMRRIINWYEERLVEPTDDGQPIDEAWLESAGFKRDDERPYWWINSTDLQFDVERWDNGDWTFSDADNTLPCPAPGTRGDVRRLCAALSIKLN